MGRFSMPALVAPRGLWFRVAFAAVLVIFFGVLLNLYNQHARMKMSFSGDEYYFYYQAAHAIDRQNGDPALEMRDRLRAAEQEADALSRRSIGCDLIIAQPLASLRQLRDLFDTELTFPVWYLGSTIIQRAALLVEPAVRPFVAPWLAAEPNRFAAELGWRTYVVLTAPIIFLLALGAGVAWRRNAAAQILLLAAFLGLHATLLPPPSEIFRLAEHLPGLPMGDQIAEFFWGTLITPRYDATPVALAPRGYVALLFLGMLALRWSGRTRWAYASALGMSLLHPSSGVLPFAMIAAADFLCRPRIFRDRYVLASAILAGAISLSGGLAGLALRFATFGWPLLLLIVLGAAAIIFYFFWAPTFPPLRQLADDADKNPLAMDLIFLGPVLVIFWLTFITVDMRYPILGAYLMVNATIRAAALAHYAITFGLFVLLGRAAIWGLRKFRGEGFAAYGVLCLALIAALVALACAPKAGGMPPYDLKLARVAAANDEVALREPITLITQRTDYFWHRIVRQKETGGNWVATAIDLAPYRACARSEPGPQAGH
jgi:hypothetical protein